jgi:sugar phosphate isomerase/epimerase
MNRSISVQLYSVRDDAGKNYENTIRRIAAMGFPCVEPAGFPGTTAEEAAKLFAELGLKAPSAHCGLPIGDDKNKLIEEALLLGHEALITGCPPEFHAHYESLDKVKAMADLYCEAAENAAPHGLQVGYHNHDWDLADIDGTRGYQVFLERTPETVLWEADLFWVARAGIDPCAFLNEIGSRGKFIHFKDGAVDMKAAFSEAETEDGKIMVSDASPFLPAGKGQVDLLAASEAATFTEVAVVELDSYEGVMMDAVEASYQYLTTNGVATGNK